MSERASSPWLDISEIKRLVPLEAVLEHYGILAGLTRRGNSLVGLSPFREESRPSFSVNLERGIWNDLGGRPQVGGQTVAGNVVGLIMALENCDFRQALLIAHERFVAGRPEEAASREVRGRAQEALRREEAVEAREAGNEPFDKELKGLRFDVPYLQAKGIKAETAKAWGVGYCTRGLMKGRVVFPVRDREGRIVFYTGRSLKEDDPRGKWRLPPDARRSLELFGIDRIAGQAAARKAARDYGLILVEGPTDAVKLAQEGFPNAVASLGAEVSDVQLELLVDPKLNPSRRVTIFFDRDEAGQRGKRLAARALIHRAFVRYADWNRAPESAADPDELDASALRQLLSLGERDQSRETSGGG